MVQIDRVGAGDAGPGPATTGPSDRIDQFLQDKRHTSALIVVDLDVVRSHYRALAALMPWAGIFYAVKANPAPEIIAALAALGAGFDLASEGEIERCRGLGVPARRCSFGNTIKRESDIKHAHVHGIDLFAFDSAGELEKLERAAPGAQVFCRLLVENKGSEWPLSGKFGCSTEMATDLLLHARSVGLRPIGVSFHVGSQQTDPNAWASAIERAAHVFHACARSGLALDMVNLGGGLPAHYQETIPPLESYVETIDRALTERFGTSRPRLVIEPGRYLVGDAGILRSHVLLIARKSRHAQRRWVYLDAGRYNGLPETLGERIRYRIRTPHDGAPTGPVVLAGPTCDSTDVIYQRTDNLLPLDLAIGDPVDFLSAGAYTASYAAVEFNGFAPIRTHCI
ncbi:MAG TPA: type III PLP-dependent enzyme [Stellaceae bacterium]|nr:type III PLP-dependent enzyme [Stellaceae bacterium]